MIVLPLNVTLRFVALKIVCVEFNANQYAEIVVEMGLLAEEHGEIVETNHGVLS